MEKLYADPTGKGSNLGKYAASAALKTAEVDSRHTHDRGNVIVGDVKVTNPSVIGIQTAGQTPYATISSCLDVTDWQTLNAATKRPVKLPDNRLTKYLINSTVEKWPEGWRVTRDEPQGKSC
ncbi:secreted protein/lipoprotein [Streptomyces sp. NPDC055722]